VRSAILMVILMVTLAGCPKKPRHRDCFDVAVGENSRATNALFEARHCQGGGVTWAPIVRVLAGRHGRVAPVEEPIEGWNGGVYLLNGKTLFSIDDEGDAAQLCADDPELLQSMKREIHHLNTDVEALKQAMAAADPEEME